MRVVTSGRRIEAGAGTSCRAYSGALVLCALMAPVLLTACTPSKVDPRVGALAPSPQIVDPGQEIPKDDEALAAIATPYKVAGKAGESGETPEGYSAEGLASWYGGGFHGRQTANGEIFDKSALSAAHPSLPLPSYARVTNVNNGRSVVVRVNDRGPFHGDRALDVSERVADVLGFKQRGMARVKIDYVGPASLKGSDDEKLLASYRDGHGTGVALARLEPAAAVPASTPTVTETPVTETPAPTPSTRIANSFSGFSSPQPLARESGMVQPVLSGYAFGPPALGGL